LVNWSTSIRRHSNESVRNQEELDRIFGPSIPYVLEIGDIYFDEDDVFNKQDKHINNKKKQRKSGTNLVEDFRDNKEVIDDYDSLLTTYFN
jgi:hypothetical protein